MDSSIELINDDYRSVIISKKANLILTDPPYYVTNLHFDKEERLDFAEWLDWCKNILEPNGVLVTFCNLSLLTELIGYKKFKSFYEIVYHKNNVTGFLSSGFRPLASHEYILVMSDKLKSSTFNPQRTVGKPYNKKSQDSLCATYSDSKRVGKKNESGDRHPITVLRYSHDKERSNSTVANMNRHPTQKPLELIKNLVRQYSNEGDLIIDPFGGAATTALACKLEGRNCISIEKHGQYHDMGLKRISHENVS